MSKLTSREKNSLLAWLSACFFWSNLGGFCEQLQISVSKTFHLHTITVIELQLIQSFLICYFWFSLWCIFSRVGVMVLSSQTYIWKNNINHCCSEIWVLLTCLSALWGSFVIIRNPTEFDIYILTINIPKHYCRRK